MTLRNTPLSLQGRGAKQRRQRALRPPGVMGAKEGGPKKWNDPEKSKIHSADSYCRHRETRKNDMRRYYFKHRDEIKAARRQRYKNNAENHKIASKRYASRPEVRIKINARERARYASQPVLKIRASLRARILRMVGGQKRNLGATERIIGCSYDEFKAHIERKFKHGMKWSNHGKVWHLDHIIPCEKFDLKKPENVFRCFNYLNYQPLLAHDNLSKGKKILQHEQIALGII